MSGVLGVLLQPGSRVFVVVVVEVDLMYWTGARG